MNKINIIGQKIKGKVQQFKGRIEDASGHPVKGAISKIKGKANEISADVKMKIEKSR